MGIAGLGGGGPDDLDTDESEERDLESTQETHHPIREETTIIPQIGEPGGVALFGDETGSQQPDSDDDQRHDGDEFDQREPELGLTEEPDRHDIQDEQHQSERGRRHPQRDTRPPEPGIAGDCGQVSHRRDNPGEPVGPAGDETARGPQQILGDVTERLVLQIGQEHLAHRPHHEVQEETNHRIDQHAGRAGLVDRLAGPHEHTGPDGATEGHQLQMPVAQPPLQLLLLWLSPRDIRQRDIHGQVIRAFVADALVGFRHYQESFIGSPGSVIEPGGLAAQRCAASPGMGPGPGGPGRGFSPGTDPRARIPGSRRAPPARW